MRYVSLLLVMAVLALACAGGAPSATTTRPEPTTSGASESGSAIPRCADVPRVEANADAYRDEPIYVANEMPVEEVQAWASNQDGYEAIWIDREHNGWITVAFSQHANARQAELIEQFPGVGVVAVGVDWHMSELESVQQEVVDELSPLLDSFATSVSVTHGVVGIDVGVLTEEVRREVAARFGDAPVCLDGRDPATVPSPGPQPTTGDGWRLLVSASGVGVPYRTGIATDGPSYAALWETVGIDNQTAPIVDFEREVVFWFGAVFGSGCESIRLDDVVVAGDIVHAEIVLPNPPVACNDDANPHAYLVAVERDQLPSGPFSIQLTADGPPAGVPEERTIVNGDLTIPGSTVTADDVRTGQAVEDPFVLRGGDFIEPGVLYPVTLATHCGVEWLSFNDVTWQASTAIPGEWREVVGEAETLDGELILTTEPAARIDVTANGVTVTYLPTTDPIPGCD